VADIGNQVGARVRLIGADEGTDINARLAELGVDIPNPVASPYPAGLIITAANRRVKSRAILLDDHLRDIAAVAQTLSDDPRVVQAAALHDIGKGDPRFQVLLGARDQPLAKSAHPSPWAARQAREWSGLPPGWRHEIASLALLQDDVADLVRYLVATHHGHGRTILPVSGDETLWHRAGGPTWGKITERLNQEHGAWGLAYKEALVRLADWIQSEREQQACSK
jgi:CRISPR-associated endonuclease/helicase Cas3